MSVNEIKDFIVKKENTKVPILEVEINIDNKVIEKCLIYEGDTPETIIQKVGQKHRLNKEEREIIMNQLKQHF